MKEKTLRVARTSIILVFIIVVIGLMIYSHVTAKRAKETFKEKLDELHLWENPISIFSLPV